MLLQKQSALLGWPVACTSSVLATIASYMLTGKQHTLQLSANSPKQNVLQLLAFKPVDDHDYGDLA
jgi:hypothetical protein